MKIISIKKSGKSKYKILLENDVALNLYDNVILNNNLLFKKEIDDELLEKLEKENEKEDIYYKVVSFISKKIRSKKEINEYLDKIDITFSLKEEIINRLESNLLINDEMYAKAYIHDKVYLSNEGPYKIKSNLIDNNIPSDIIEKLIYEIDQDEIKQKLEKLIIKRIKGNSNKSNYILKQKIMLEMINLGYDKGHIEELINNNLSNNEVLIIKKEYDKVYRKLSSKYNGNELLNRVYHKLRQKGFPDTEIRNIEQEKTTSW